MFTVTPSSSSLSPEGPTPQENQHDHGLVSASTANTPNQIFNKPSSSTVANAINPGVKIDDVNPVESLKELLKCILTIIQGYSDFSHSSNLYLSSLDHYRLRTEKLLGFARRLENVPSPVVILDDANDGDCDDHQDPEIDTPSRQDLMREIYKLEEEWWNSEVVASWYGPRPRPRYTSRRLSSSHKGIQDLQVLSIAQPTTNIQQNSMSSPPPTTVNVSPSPKKSKTGMTLIDQQRARRHRISPRDLTALTEEERESPHEDDLSETRTKTITRRNAATQAQVSILTDVGWLRRDSSYVGLHDE
ncbi:hypothetical protein L486_04092 [Kwoniella mangroviensis CBS 10435]|uniref:Uncharacterized protein n=1 Tax=Kwoniella mangroviensis CBS 10435 TaxID=1331196 RepID=A0A1B9IR86_9TREE|nr:hypothetical protein L486_04092 [Kwoniella mangroviensis CBS 10435]